MIIYIGDDWYKARVKHITDSGKCNLVYEDGDVEDDVSIGRIRRIKRPDGAVDRTGDIYIFEHEYV
jgi:hypothetical protein